MTSREVVKVMKKQRYSAGKIQMQ